MSKPKRGSLAYRREQSPRWFTENRIVEESRKPVTSTYVCICPKPCRAHASQP